MVNDPGSNDLVNADYRFGLMTGYRTGRLSGSLRLYHQSSHLGDEFVLNSQVNRLNLSYEELDLKLSFDAASWLRLYGGWGLLVRRGEQLVSARPPVRLSPSARQRAALLERIALAGTRAVNREHGITFAPPDWTSRQMPET